MEKFKEMFSTVSGFIGLIIAKFPNTNDLLSYLSLVSVMLSIYFYWIRIKSEHEKR